MFSQVCDKKTVRNAARGNGKLLISLVVLNDVHVYFFLVVVKPSVSKKLLSVDSQVMSIAYSSNEKKLFSM